MGLFDNVKMMAEDISKSINNVQSTLSVQCKEFDKKRDLEKELSLIDSEISLAYKEIGKRYVDFVIQSNEMPGIDVSDILKILDEKFSRKEDLNTEIIIIEKKLDELLLLREKEKENKKFNLEKEKLDKALNLNIITQDDYDSKLQKHQNRLYHFDEIRKLEKQYELGIITFEEKQIKIDEFLNL